MLEIIETCWRSCRSSFGVSDARSLPSMTTLPDVGCSRKLMQRTSVDLPAPDMPMMPENIALLDLQVDVLQSVHRLGFALEGFGQMIQLK